MRVRFVGAVVGACVLFGPGPGLRLAHAEVDDGTHFHLSYQAPATCPDRAAFLAAIRQRTRRPHLAAEGEPATTFSVSIETTPTTTVGRLDVQEPDGAPQRRTVSSRTCAEVTKALALVAALILDPEAETSSEPPPLTGEPSGPAVPAHPAPSRLSRPERPRPERVPPSPPRRALVKSAGAELGLSGAIGPGLAPGVGAFADLQLAPGPEASGLLRLTPSARFTAAFAGTSTDLTPDLTAGGSHSYWLASGTFRVCPVQLAPGPSGLTVAPCGAVQVGAHHGTTTDVPNPSASTSLWVAPQAELSLEWQMSSSVSLELHGGATFPLLRTRFFLAPSTTIFVVPAISAGGGLAVRVRFW